MLWAQLQRDVPDVAMRLESGDLAAVTGWLRRAVHVPGARESAGATIVRITGQPLSAASFLSYAERKFGAAAD
jgi:Zn-dependent M32 family carboxypeptidase